MTYCPTCGDYPCTCTIDDEKPEIIIVIEQEIDKEQSGGWAGEPGDGDEKEQ